MVFDARSTGGSRTRRDATRPAGRRPRSAAPDAAADAAAEVADPATPEAEGEVAPVTLRLDGKVALVTGAGSPDGIGYATARRLRDLGARVAIVSTTRRIHERAAELGITGFVADLTDEAEVGALADAISDQLGDVEVLVNNAGLASRASPEVLRPVAQLTYDEWKSEIDRNLSTAFLCSRAVQGGMAERGWGRIVNLAAT
ncbi:MAG TPA: SDR family NAD(P)-dependent oxidoreductase, partial [Actinoplanes sp.]